MTRLVAEFVALLLVLIARLPNLLAVLGNVVQLQLGVHQVIPCFVSFSNALAQIRFRLSLLDDALVLDLRHVIVGLLDLLLINLCAVKLLCQVFQLLLKTLYFLLSLFLVVSQDQRIVFLSLELV